MRSARAAVALLVLLPACGKRGDPLPPLRKTPAPITTFRLAQRGDRLEIRYTAPRASVDGLRLGEMAVEVTRLDREGDINKVGKKSKRRVNPAEEVVALEPLPPPGTVVHVALRALAGGDATVRTPVATLTVLAPFEAPKQLAANLVPEGVALEWKGPKPTPAPTPTPSPSPSPFGPRPSPPPGTATAPASLLPTPAPTPPPFGGGFSVYRRAQNGTYAGPLTTKPVETNKLVDTGAPLGTRWCYVVRGVAGLEPLIESAASDEACLDVKDIFPPAPPSGLAALVGNQGVELVWSPSSEPDLAGYRLWRSVGRGAPERLTERPVGEHQYVDTTAARGTAYRYFLTAFDQAGNESKPGASVEARP